MEQAPELVEALRLNLARYGIDIVQPLALGWYNESIPPEIGACIPACGPQGQAALAVLVANSRALWEPFLAACAAQDLLQQDNPLEAYLEGAVRGALAQCAPGLGHRLYWSHRRAGDLVEGPQGASEHVAFQRMAHHAGLAFLDNSSHLCLHPRFGPWFSLRCCIIFDALAWPCERPPEPHNPLPAATQQYVRMALHTAVHTTSRKFHLPEVDVEAAEASLMEASMEAVVEEEEREEEQEGASSRGHVRLPGASSGGSPARCPSASTLSEAGSERACGSGGSTPTCSSGASSPRAPAAPPAGPEGAPLATAAARLAAVSLAAEAAGSGPGSGAASARSVSPTPSACLPAGSMNSMCSRRSSLEGPEGRPCIRAVAANWRAWVAVRDSPCPGHPMRYSEEQIVYHYTRDRAVLAKALLRRGCAGRVAAALPASGLLDPALQSYHSATMEAQKSAGRRRDFAACSELAAEAAAGGGAAITAP